MSMSKHPADDKAPASGSDLFLDGSTFCFYWDNADTHFQRARFVQQLFIGDCIDFLFYFRLPHPNPTSAHTKNHSQRHHCLLYSCDLLQNAYRLTCLFSSHLLIYCNWMIWSIIRAPLYNKESIRWNITTST